MEQKQQKKRDAEATIMAKKLQLRKKLARSSGAKAEEYERRLAVATQEEDNLGYEPISAEISFPPQCSALPGELLMNPKDWALADCLPRDFWDHPGLNSCNDDETVFGQFDAA